MSALPPKADIGIRSRNVRFVPKADILRCGKERRYSITSSAPKSSDCGTVSPSAFAVLRLMTSSFGRDLHWKVPRLFALEDAIDIAGHLRKLVELIGPIGDQTAGGGVHASRVNRWQLVLGRKPDDEIATATALNRGAGND